ncbi:MAG: hypothetical protein RRC07_12580 [Anaerolineae bacterium]|nr:hypothetical protein [Anaerolineae bacterium]
MKTRRAALKQTMPVLVLTLLFALLIVFLALHTAGGVRRSQAVVASYDDVLPACEGQAVKGAPPYEATVVRLHPVVLLRRAGSGWAPDPSALPATWMPDEPAAAELVLCLEASLPLTAPACSEDSAPAVYGYATTARLIAVATGETVASSVLNSAPDPGCWETEPEAAPLRNEQVQAWLARFVDAGGDE